MIIGIGTDLANINRIEATLKRFGDRFRNRVFTELEQQKASSRSHESSTYAKRWAAKEACSKALGTGLARGVFWKDIEVQNDKFGKPKIKLHNNALKFLKKMTKNDNCIIKVSLSDEKKYAIANVIIYEKEKR